MEMTRFVSYFFVTLGGFYEILKGGNDIQE